MRSPGTAERTIKSTQLPFSSYASAAPGSPFACLIDLDFDATIFRAALSCPIIGDRLRFAKSLTRNPAGVHTLLDEIAAHGCNAPFGELLVIRIRADVIRMARE